VNTYHTLIDAQRTLADARSAFLYDLQQALWTLPDNPDVQRKAPNCCVIQWSALRDNWSAEYHDFYYQYARIYEHLVDAKDIVRAISVLFETDRIPISGILQRSIKLHPKVKENLKRYFMFTGDPHGQQSTGLGPVLGDHRLDLGR
jgi:hypothetical protein